MSGSLTSQAAYVQSLKVTRKNTPTRANSSTLDAKMPPTMTQKKSPLHSRMSLQDQNSPIRTDPANQSSHRSNTTLNSCEKTLEKSKSGLQLV